MKKILITGLNSYLGNSFETYLSQWPEKYQVDKISLRDDSWKKEDFSGYDAVYHVAGIAHSDRGRISSEKAAMYYRVNTDLTIDVASKAKEEGVKQFVFMSSAIVYGDSAPIGKHRVITAQTPVSPSNSYGDSKVKAENGILPMQSKEFQVAVVRAPMIYGRGSKGNYPLLSKLAKSLPVFPYVENQRSMIYIENILEFIRQLIENEEHGIFWPQNQVYANTSELVEMIAEANGRKIYLIKGFSWMLKILSHVTGLVNKAFGSFCYDQGLSRYKHNYCIKNLEESIKETEGIL